MTPILAISIGFNVVLVILVLGAAFVLNRAGALINQYEMFYGQTTLALEKQVNYLQKLMKRNVLLGEDEDVVQMVKALKASYQTILDYQNAANRDNPGARKAGQKLLRQAN